MSKVTVEKPLESKLKDLKVETWGTWECEPSTFPWQYDDRETCYVYEGRVTVNTEDGDIIEIEPGDLVVFPRGLKCTWTVHEKIRKVYRFG